MSDRTVTGILFSASLAACVLLAGCNGSSTSRTTEKKPKKDAATRASTVLTEARCNEILDQAFDMLQPDRLGVTSEQSVAVDLLNQWLQGCGGQVTIEPVSAETTPELQGAIEPAAWERSREKHFGPRDAGHIRNALLFRAVNQAVLAGAQSDLERVARLFEYVSRNVALEQPQDHLPLSPYEVVMFGRGSAQDRAWVFAELLRQFRIEALILRAGTVQGQDPASDRAGEWLVGAVLGTDIYLFDARRGTALPAASETAPKELAVTPTTLDDLAATQEAYRSPRVEIIGSSSYWSERMQRLQESLAGERSVVVYDPLVGPGHGALARVRELGEGRWDAANVGVWAYPEEQWVAFENMDAETSGRLQARWAPFSAPVPVANIGAGDQIEMGRPQHEQLKTRLRHLLGELRSAVTNYLAIRVIEQKPPVVEDKFVDARFHAEVLASLPADVQQIHRGAAEDALFWTGVAQLELGEDVPAYSTLAAYLSRYREGDWTDHARLLAAGIFARAGRPEEALQLVENFDPASPQAAELGFVVDRLRKIAEGDGSPEEKQ